MSDLINRPEYLTQLIQNKDVDLVKIVTGIRRCGKSSLLDLFHQYLSANHVPDSNIIHMNLESLRYRDLTDHLSFYDYVSARIDVYKRQTPSFLPVADRQYFAREVEPVFKPVTWKLVAILSSLLVLERQNSLEPCFVTWVIFSIHMVE